MPAIKARLHEIPGIDDGMKLVVSGPNIMKGYLRHTNPGVIEEPENGWYDTGDIVSVDEKGYVAIKGRAKRFAKIAGEMISLTATEVNISKLDPKSAHGIVALPDPKKGEQLILMTTNKELKRSDISAYFKENQITELSVPKDIMAVDDLPLLGTGKIDYVTMKEIVTNNYQK